MVGESLCLLLRSLLLHSAHPQIFHVCEHAQKANSSSSFTLAPYKRPPPLQAQPLAGRGGSVSRRDHNQVTRNRPLSGGTKPEAKTPLQRQPLFGRRGLGRRGFSQRSRLLPRVSPPNRLFRREREGGGFSTEKPPPSQYYLLSYPSVLKSSMRLRQSGRTLTQSFRLTCRPRSFSMSARASLPIC